MDDFDQEFWLVVVLGGAYVWLGFAGFMVIERWSAHKWPVRECSAIEVTDEQ